MRLEVGTHVQVARPDWVDPVMGPSWPQGALSVRSPFTGKVVRYQRVTDTIEWVLVSVDPKFQGPNTWYCDQSWITPMGGPW